MNISSDIKSFGFLRSKAVDLLKQINETHRPVTIMQNGEQGEKLRTNNTFHYRRWVWSLYKLLKYFGANKAECNDLKPATEEAAKRIILNYSQTEKDFKNLLKH